METNFDAYWDGIDQELAKYEARPLLEVMPRHSNEHCTVYSLRLTSVGPYRIFGYYSVPHGAGPFPAVLNTPKYGSVNAVPDYNDRMRYVCLTLMHRGQRLADQPFAAPYPGLLTLGIDSPDSYIYRGIAADCIRGAEFLQSRSEVDQSRICIQGDDLAVITAARRPQFAIEQVAGLMFYRTMEASARTSAYPLEEINDYLRANPSRRDAVSRTISYFNPQYHAPRVTATSLLNVGTEGSTTGASWLQPLAEAFKGPVESYELTNEGGTDHDWLDAWTANKFGTEPMSRFIQSFA
jgi:cephalosporin-C deacetylase-like acetyl esterase